MDKSKKKQKCSDSIFKKTLDPPCEEYLSEKQALDSVQKGTSLKGKIRVNPKNYQHAYIDNPSGGQDILIESAQNRNRAFSNDIVVVQLLREDQWKRVKDIVDKPSTETVLTEKLLQLQDGSVTVEVTGSSGQGDVKSSSFERDVEITQKTGKVVHILRENHPRVAPGCLTAYDKSMGKVLFSPADPSIPRVIVPLDQCPQGEGIVVARGNHLTMYTCWTPQIIPPIQRSTKEPSFL
jgi:DIS3-like exonuclease 2